MESNCANCNESFKKKTGDKGYYRYSLENNIPNTDLSAREVFKEMPGIQIMTPVSKKRQGRFLCPVCWNKLVESHRYNNSLKEFWGRNVAGKCLIYYTLHRWLYEIYIQNERGGVKYTFKMKKGGGCKFVRNVGLSFILLVRGGGGVKSTYCICNL
jgi:hypothetical protein